MRSIFTISMRAAWIPALAFATGLAMSFGAAPVRAQAADDDLYGVPGTTSPAPAASEPSTPADTTPVPEAVVAPIVPVDTVRAPAPTPAPRQRVTRETTINPLDSKRGAYRNPKKALFMSLMVPGLGQAYVGQTTFNYARAALYFGTEIGLGILWYEYSVVKYDREVKRYKRYADANWSQGIYEDRVFTESGLILAENFRNINPYRASYCESVTGRGSEQADSLFTWCSDPSENPNYLNFKTSYENDKAAPANTDSVGAFRAAFSDPTEFYALIGSYQEFVSGWRDAAAVVYSSDSITGTSASRDTYNSMRDKAQEYSRMQAWFIGGIVLNHIASAVDAALTAHRNNRVLYEGDARWYDNLHVEGGLAFEGGRPLTRMAARLAF